ncbi:rRNA maturation RNase YbeY [Enterobacteriaceae endosymbiont of Neohaemonia nigricornis]|uniref:rRNA maturation RNase YbeY n=1 Tax=Enterobacteriaceae endosymbiont of Neohaemonia nigricornis TaxID=2675792 RepID=UPI00144A2621|nr:rRNA maturation RNase YbeY [Enterobacteriaceae endosymbiont of Neohaemonia nigricornis]QJC30487.1 rRNA maturation RNase YbeY [Enterobacteriaceae endosymbiont of Neohaemonia nigricornis]
MHYITLNYYHNCINNTNMPMKSEINIWLYTVFVQSFKKDANITISIVTKQNIKQLNIKYLKKNKYTNVLCFPYNDLNNTKKIYGDIILCKQIIEQEALNQKKILKAHWAHLIIHSSLHLLNFDHNNDNNALKMESQEINILNMLGYNNPYV